MAGFFVLAAVGYFHQVPLFLCGLRGLAGAAVLYVMTQVAGKMVLNILVDAMIQNRNIRGPTRERRSR